MFVRCKQYIRRVVEVEWKKKKKNKTTRKFSNDFLFERLRFVNLCFQPTTLKYGSLRYSSIKYRTKILFLFEEEKNLKKSKNHVYGNTYTQVPTNDNNNNNKIGDQKGNSLFAYQNNSVNFTWLGIVLGYW